MIDVFCVLLFRHGSTFADFRFERMSRTQRCISLTGSCGFTKPLVKIPGQIDARILGVIPALLASMPRRVFLYLRLRVNSVGRLTGRYCAFAFSCLSEARFWQSDKRVERFRLSKFSSEFAVVMIEKVLSRLDEFDYGGMN
jgi:hypothetical protein